MAKVFFKKNPIIFVKKQTCLGDWKMKCNITSYNSRQKWYRLFILGMRIQFSTDEEQKVGH